MIILNIFSINVRAYRWAFFFNKKDNISIGTLNLATFIGFMANNVMPVRIGELVRAFIVSKRDNLEISKSLATIVVERIFDVISILMVFGFISFYLKFNTKQSLNINIPDWLHKASLISLIVATIALVFLILTKFFHEQLLFLLDSLYNKFKFKFIAKIKSFVHFFIEGLNILGSFSRILIVFLLSMLIWAILSAGIMLSFPAFEYKFKLPWISSLFMLTIMAFAVSVPSAPGFIGTFHWACIKGLQLLGINKFNRAYAIIIHAASFIPITLIGLILTIYFGISFKEIKKYKNK